MEGHLGVSQEFLFGLYPQALKTLKGISRSSPSTEELRTLTACTSVAVLANPAHQHCLNLRKELMMRKDVCIRPEKELSFLEATMSASKSFAKQSALWSHRRWILDCLFPSGPTTVGDSPRVTSSLPQPSSFEISDLSRISPTVVAKEIQLVYKACDLYPRNYYAWMHAQFCIEVLFRHLQHSRAREEAHKVLRSHITAMQRWIEQHISDYSAVHHLCNISHRLASDGTLDVDITELEGLDKHALSLLERYPSHESLWMYLRISVAMDPDAASRNKRIQAVAKQPLFHGREAAICSAWWELQDGSQEKTNNRVESLRMTLRCTQNS
ncbi:hypothetical protein BDV98DRAFT_13314 [Pterulicium gracile]|uniref:Protein prenylyltransferase n=1 Tax=Pterulicium gracile TaxID=1884261 RepID=A0A5C3R211_9AGAR|nr:hypothetical protein BDV98DRAFT_13314 [Pterula gracilis]